MSTKTYYSKDHEWVRVDGNSATIGITDYAQSQLGDVVYVELPDAGKTLSAGKEAAVVESVKAASDVYAPISGEVTENNQAVADEPSLINNSPQEDGWFFRMTIADSGELAKLMDTAAYETYLKDLA